MSLLLSSALFAFLFLQVRPTHGKSITVSVRQYSGLRRTDIRGVENQYYFFQFCSCPRTFTDKTVKVNQCVCSEAQKGKKLENSIPQANFFSSSENCGTGSCIYAKIDNEQGEKLFVKVFIGSTVLTYPEYQMLPVRSSKSDAILKTTRRSKMRMSYTADEKENDKKHSKVENEAYPWSNSILRDIEGGASGFFRRFSSQKKNEKKQPTLPVDTDVNRLSSIGSIKSYLFSNSKLDKQDPARYDIPSLKQWLVTYHNIYRLKHGAPALTVDSVLEHRGKRWADELAYHKGCLVHEQPRSYGENLFFFGARHLPSPQTLAAAVIQSFYIEGIGYNYSSWKPLSFFKTGHFTQLIWKSSRKIGVGVSIVKSSSIRSPCISSSPNTYFIFVVVKYDPAGNFESQKAYLNNVERPID